MSFFETARDILSTNREYRCRGCGITCGLSDLNQDMLCELCGEPEVDPEYEDPTEDELRRDERTWSV